MTVQTFRDLVASRPFQLSLLVMSSGQAHGVRQPTIAWPTRTNDLVGIDITDDGLPAEFRIFSLSHVIVVEPLSAPSAGSKPGGSAESN